MIEFILYVADPVKSTAFYRSILHREPVLNMPGMTEFLLAPDCKLGLMPESGIATILGDSTPHPASGSGIPRCELYLRVADVHTEYLNAIQAGAQSLHPVIRRDWGDTVGYLLDPDGHVIAFATKSSDL
jgi:lactoylglutathione lyase